MCPRFLAYFKCFKTYLSDSAVARLSAGQVGDPPEGFRSRFQVDKAFKAPLRFLGFFLDRWNLSTNKLLGSCCVRGPQRYGDCV